MPHIKRALLASSLLGLFSPLWPLVGMAAEAEEPLTRRIQQALNASNGVGLSALVAGEYASDLESRFRIFSERFPDARWTVRSGDPLKDGRLTIEVDVRGRRQTESQNYVLEASQRLALITEDDQIIGEEVISEQSILSSASKPLPISLLIPDAVLSGSRYDVDVIFDQPLGHAMVAAGLIALTPIQVRLQTTPDIKLSPMHGGGLFKSVQAPFTPGSQTWAAMLVHPDGFVIVTKRVRVVSDSEDLTP